MTRRFAIKTFQFIKINGFALAASLFFVICSLYSGALAGTQLQGSQQVYIAKAVFCFDEASFTKAWISLIWWRLILTLVAGIMSVWIIGSIFSFLAQLIECSVWAMSWACVFSVIEEGIFGLFLIFIIPLSIFILAATFKCLFTGKCLLKAFKTRNIPKTPLDSVSGAYPMLINIARSFGLSAFGAVFEIFIIYLIEI